MTSLTGNAEYDQLLEDKREESRRAHHAVQTMKAEYDRAVQKDADLAAVLAKLEPRCPLCNKEVAGYDHDACIEADGVIETAAGYPVCVGDRCHYCKQPFALTDAGRIGCYKPWMTGQFWHLTCAHDEEARDRPKEADAPLSRQAT